MKFTELELPGAFLVETEKMTDERGFFARSFCMQEFKKYGLCHHFEQCNISYNHKKDTLRGMHYQTGDNSEAKVVRCTKGAIYDVIIDLRPNSPTFKKWTAVELTDDNHKMLYIPEHFAHGFLTLKDNSEVYYQMSVSFSPGHAGGVRWNDPAFEITWPCANPKVISTKDQQYSDFAS